MTLQPRAYAPAATACRPPSPSARLSRTAAAARSTPARSTSRCVQARSRCGPPAGLIFTPRSLSAAESCAAAPNAVAASISSRLTRLAVDHSLGQPQIAVQGDTVVLRGVAQSDSQRRVLERLILLEPGVLNVRNEMVLAGATSEESLPQPGN